MVQITDAERWSQLRILDGGFGTELENLGFPVDEDPLWSAAALIDRPELVIEVHKKFILAGCNVILSNSYHANIRRLMSSRKLSENEAKNVVKRSVDLAFKAISECKKENCALEVIGSVGSYSTALSDGSEYNGHYVDEVEESVLVHHHIQQSIPLLEAGLKTLAYETVPALLEVRAISKALNKLPSDINCWISLTCKDDEHTNHGDSFQEAAKIALSHPKVFGVGINCTAPMYISQLLSRIQPFLNGKIAIVYPNSGEGFHVESKSWVKESNEVIYTREKLEEWRKLGVKLVGGCCRVKPEDICTLANIARDLT